MLTWGRAGAVVVSPITPATAGPSPAGTRALPVVTRTVCPPGRRASTTDSAKARSIRATVPVTGMSSRSGDVMPTESPVDRSHARVAATVAGRGPNSSANCPAAR